MIGVDLIFINRMEKMIQRFGDKALQRFLHPSEIALITKPSTAAGFWAAKEAAAKALQTGIGKECSFFDITLSKTPKGAPQMTFSPRLMQTYNIQKVSVSITHDGGIAAAVVALQIS